MAIRVAVLAFSANRGSEIHCQIDRSDAAITTMPAAKIAAAIMKSAAIIVYLQNCRISLRCWFLKLRHGRLDRPADVYNSQRARAIAHRSEIIVDDPIQSAIEGGGVRHARLVVSTLPVVPSRRLKITRTNSSSSRAQARPAFPDGDRAAAACPAADRQMWRLRPGIWLIWVS
jgi:hypothetical protein